MAAEWPEPQTRHWRTNRVELRAAGFDPDRARDLDLAHAGATRKALSLLGVTGETSARAARRRDER